MIPARPKAVESTPPMPKPSKKAPKKAPSSLPATAGAKPEPFSAFPDSKAKKNPVKITELLLRDAHQSLLATRMRTEDMLPICGALDAIGFWSLEVWGGATFDCC